MNDIQEFLSGRDEMAQGTKAMCEVTRALTEIYYSIDRHERWMEREKRGKIRGGEREERKMAVA